MLLLNLNKIRTAQDRFEQVYRPDQFDVDEDFRVVEPVSLAFDVFKDNQAFDLRYQPHTVNAGEGEREIEEDDLTTAFYENDEIDLGHLMHEQFVLSLPMKPLCEEACKGLCPECGTNLNRGTCDCKPVWEDPRLAALRELRTKN